MWRGLAALFVLSACGFQTLPGGDDLAGADLAGLDLAGADLAGARDLTAVPGTDLAVAADLAMPTGPGPLGALPAGFCCNSNEECRSRECRSDGAGPRYCSDDCLSDAICQAWGGSFHCDQSSNRCISAATPYTCLPADQYPLGNKPILSCCAHGFAKSGQECAGGLCEATGNDANPFYCTQGCDAATPCPGGYSCVAGFCWVDQSFTDPNFIYSCQ